MNYGKTWQINGILAREKRRPGCSMKSVIAHGASSKIIICSGYTETRGKLFDRIIQVDKIVAPTEGI